MLRIALRPQNLTAACQATKQAVQNKLNFGSSVTTVKNCGERLASTQPTAQNVSSIVERLKAEVEAFEAQRAARLERQNAVFNHYGVDVLHGCGKFESLFRS
ncbi:hypothetical protein O1O06_14850 [Grimontia hollisae]|uniref:hypothetical protein n=1 Tax=Grimontia hollisae TaxID=673 RepID=UPI0023D9F3A2|nr:hypothetical protein [Grimontia hollisae]MDF2186019.1 hypothetical protein [Grimontia hollisae]